MSSTVRTALTQAAYAFFVAGTMAALLTLMGHGPVSRWVAPWLLITVGYGIVAGFRARRTPARTS
jgi:hypothetical protein